MNNKVFYESRDFEFGRVNISFTEFSIASRASTRHARQRRLMLLMSRPMFAWGIRHHSSWECIRELVDVLCLVRPSPDTSPEDVPQTFSWRQVWGFRWLWESRDSAKLQVIFDNTGTMILRSHADGRRAQQWAQ